MRPADDLSPAVVEALSDYEDRIQHGEIPKVDDYRERLGAEFVMFTGLVDTRSALLEIVEPGVEDTDLPREFGPYTLIRVLGRGGAGEVYEARNNRVGRLEALKILREVFEPGTTTFQRFDREAAACARVQHPNVARVHAAGEIDGRPYYSMELIEGPTLKGWARDGNLTSVSQLFERMADVADAVQALHEAGVIHRDIKPSNILVRPDGTFVLADFGLAHTELGTTLTASGEMLGTPYYMSPEQLVGNRSQIGPASDVYSIGATLYDLLARRPPFEASAVLELLSMHGNERPVPLSRLAAHVPKDAEHIVMMCLEHDPADRYATAAELRDDLRAFAKRQPVVGRPVHELRRVIRWIRRLGPVLAAGVVLAGLLLFGFLTRDATLKLEVTNTVAEITLDGEARGATPQTFELASGVHRFRLSATGFAPHESERELAPGGNVEIAKDLQVLPDDKDGLARLSELVGMPAPDVSRVDGTRSVVKGGAAAALVYPAGRIRAVDLRRARFEVYDILEVGEGGDLLIVRTSDGDELFRTTPDLEAGGLRVDIAIPQSVRDALRPGDEVEIAYRIGEQEWKKTATIVAPDPELDTLLARIDERLESQEPWVRAWFRARALLERGFATAALDELRAVVNLDVGAGTQPLVPVVKAVEALKALDAGASALAQEFVVLMESFPDDAKAVWIRRRPGSD